VQISQARGELQSEHEIEERKKHLQTKCSYNNSIQFKFIYVQTLQHEKLDEIIITYTG
jgi:hypothetical protein